MKMSPGWTKAGCGPVNPPPVCEPFTGVWEAWSLSFVFGERRCFEPTKYTTLSCLHHICHVGGDNRQAACFSTLHTHTHKGIPQSVCVCVDGKVEKEFMCGVRAAFWGRGAYELLELLEVGLLSCHCSTSHHNWNHEGFTSLRSSLHGGEI